MRIPNDFLPQDKRESLFGYMIARKTKLVDEFSAWTPAP
jgi:hypothetical protein